MELLHARSKCSQDRRIDKLRIMQSERLFSRKCSLVAVERKRGTYLRVRLQIHFTTAIIRRGLYWSGLNVRRVHR